MEYFRYIGQTTDSGETAEGEDPDEESSPISRRAPDPGSMDEMLGDEDPAYRPDDPALYDPTSVGDSLKKSLEEAAKQFTEFFKSALFGNK